MHCKWNVNRNLQYEQTYDITAEKVNKMYKWITNTIEEILLRSVANHNTARDRKKEIILGSQQSFS